MAEEGRVRVNLGALVVAGTAAALGAGVLAMSARSRSSALSDVASGALQLVPRATPLAVLWVTSSGNIGLRGVVAVVDGDPRPDMKIPPSCRHDAELDGAGTVTVCLDPQVAQVVARNLGGFLEGAR